MELEQGKGHNVSGHMIGITTTYEAGGSRLVNLMVLEPSTRKETSHRLQVGDTLQLGPDKYKITAIGLAAGAKRGSITIQKA